MSAKIIRKNGKSYIQLPESFSELEEVELFQLKGNFWLLSAPLGKPGGKEEEKPEKRLTQAEKSVLQKLMEIRFADRTPSKIEKTFSPEEKALVRQLIKQGLIQVFYGKKYEKTGVYNIPNEIYPLISHEEARKAGVQKEAVQKAAAVKDTAAQAKPAEAKAIAPASYSELAKTGWTVIPHPRDAEQFSMDLKKSGVSQNVKGVRGFDGRFYVATNRFLYAAYEKIKSVLEKKKEMYTQEIAAATNIEPDAVLAVMHILAESGEVIEKKRGLFCLA